MPPCRSTPGFITHGNPRSRPCSVRSAKPQPDLRLHTATLVLHHVCCRINLYGDQDTPPAAARTPTRDVAHRAAHRNHDTARGPGGPCSVAARWTAYANRRCAAAAVATKTNQTIPGTCRAGSVIHGAKPPGARRLTRWLLEFSNCVMTTSGNARGNNGVHGNVAPSDRFR
jgi:hypothetical protein